MEQKFQGQNLRGKSFKGLDLREENFSYADLRGTDFTNTILKGVNFRNAKFGLPLSLVVLLLISSILLSALSGIGLKLALTPLISAVNNKFVSGVTILFMLATFSLITIRRGLLIAGLVTLIVAVIIAVVAAGIGSGSDGFATGALVGVIVGVGIIATFGCGVLAVSVAGAVAMNIAEKIAIAGVGVVALLGAGVVAVTEMVNNVTVVATILTGTGIILGAYIAIQALAGDKNFTFIQQIAVAFAAIGGTSFRGADLTDANFTQATLKSTDFRGAILTRTRWYQAKKLDRARVGDSILCQASIRDLLVSGNGYKKFYIGANLKGANLTGANLEKANLKEADISQATLQEANLKEANLTKTQAVGTYFTNAYLTGACLEAWNIDSTTRLDRVDCQCVYLLEHEQPGSSQRGERRPSSGKFAPGEFTKLFEEVLNTVDLIFRDGIDWKAFAVAFKKVQVENEGTELAIQSIENKGNGVVVVRVSVPPDANKEKIHSDFTQNYELALKAVEEKYKAELKAKDDQIEFHRHKSSEMKEIIGLLASRPVINEVNVTAESKAMTESTDASRKIKIGDVGGDFKPIGSQFSSDNVTVDISGTVAETINQLPTSPEPDKPGIKELLTQLQTAIEADTNLTQEDKAEALEQLKALAEAGKNPQEGAMQKTAKTAMKILKGTIASLPSAATLVEACSKLLPAIASLLGLG
jgi:uncharacterized protein YjbI with pentapeptide repeats